MNRAAFRRRRFCDCRAGCRLHSPQARTAIHTASSGLLRRVMSMIAKVSSTGWKQIFAMARDEMRRFSSLKPGAAPWTMTGPSCLKLRSWQPLSAAHRNSRLNRRSRRRPASPPCGKSGPMGFWTGSQKQSASAMSSLLSRSFSELHWEGNEFRLTSRCPLSCRVGSPIW